MRAGEFGYVLIKAIGDERGCLSVLESHQFEFNIERVYWLTKSSPFHIRGKHAHLDLGQVIIAINGSCRILLDNGSNSYNLPLVVGERALVLRGLLWRELSEFSDDAVILVLASQPYCESDYIRDYDEFRRLAL